MVLLAVAVAVLLVQEKVLVRAVAGKRNGGNAQAGEARLEAVPAGEDALVPPCLMGLPWVVAGSAAGLAKGADVEAGDVGLGALGRT